MAELEPGTPFAVGLSTAEAVRRLSRDGPNALPQRDRRRWPQLVAGVLREAAFIIGNDTGPMHIAAAAGCPSLVLFSAASDPALCGQRGPSVAYLRRPRLADLAVDEVEAALRLR